MTPCKLALDLLSTVPNDEFITGKFSDEIGKCCAIGHFKRLSSKNPSDYSMENCSDREDNYPYLRQNVKYAMLKLHGTDRDLADVNNNRNVNGYTDRDIKTRVIQCLQDCVNAGF